MSSHEVGKDLKRITSPNTPGNMDSKALTRELVHHHHQFHRPSVIGPDKHKIPRPHVVAMLRTKPHARPVIQPQSTALRLFCRHFQALSTPDPHHPPRDSPAILATRARHEPDGIHSGHTARPDERWNASATTRRTGAAVYTAPKNAICPMLGTPGVPRHPESIALVTPPAAAAPGSVVSLRHLFEDLLVYR